jgi:fatty-acyl-CoA synthase
MIDPLALGVGRADPIDPVDTGEDDLALMQLTSGSTGPPKAVQITHRNLASNAEAMFIGAECDLESDVIVSWLPLFHDMGMTGFLTVPMCFGAELVKISPIDFLSDTLLWAKLIDKYKGTMTAAPNFAYALFANRLRKRARPGQFDLSTLRWALSGAEQVEPADVEDLCEAGAPFGLRPQAILPAYRMAETTVAVSFSECGAGLVVDEVDADMLAVLHRAVPSTKGNTRRLATLGPLLRGLEARIVDEDAIILPTRGVGVIQVRGEPLTRGYTTVAGFVSALDDQGWYDTGDMGYLTENGHVVVCGRVKDVIIMAGRNIHPTDIERAAGRVEGVRRGCAVAVRLEAGHSREAFAVAVESNNFDDRADVRRIQRQVAHEVVAEVDVRPRNVVVLGPGTIPKTPSGKLRRAHALSLVGGVAQSPLVPSPSAAHPGRWKVMAMYDKDLNPNWHVEIAFDEDETHTHATVRAQRSDGEAMTARGDAYRNPKDNSQPMIGEEIAAARALIALGTELLQSASSRIEQVTHQPVHLYH